MSISIHAADVRIRRDIRGAEAKADEALLAKIKLMESLILARQSDEVDVPHVGQKAMIRLGRSIQTEIDSASDLFRVHDELVKVREVVGIGDEDGSTPAAGLEESDLARVA
ncbi:hypothetical protein GCM10011371_21950 [Novosphingobium marinum]|uniref:Uncharacterized protein n=1 Tax=Novosphingobium marinum TaxID=1514948 RepID=A0A7Y9XXC4_9SPHN|nr:hypothetical protein [Novosphingobium marinum]NYH96309.1 hypothetical protein [Novosphingobium marinum]GGC34230.1 hypothetical protein GCM10011371_21950 [Novosphingobium marinum]